MNKEQHKPPMWPFYVFTSIIIIACIWANSCNGQTWGVLPSYVNGIFPDTKTKQAIQSDFGLIRTTCILSKWDGTEKTDNFYKPFTGGNILLTIVWQQPFINGQPQPVNFCSDTALYRKKVAQLIAYTKEKTICYMVENEPCNQQFYFTDTNKLKRYFQLLNIAADEANKAGRTVTDGGTTTTMGSILTYEYYLPIDTSFAAKLGHIYLNDSMYNTLPERRQTKQYKDAITLGNYYLQNIASSHIDNVNLHWYEPCQLRNGGTTYSSVKMKGCEKVIYYLKKQTCRPVIITETAQLINSDHDTNKMVMRYKKLAVPIVVWFNGGDCLPYFDETGNPTELGTNLLNQIK